MNKLKQISVFLSIAIITLSPTLFAVDVHAQDVVDVSVPIGIGTTITIPLVGVSQTPAARQDPEGMYTYIAPLGQNFTGTIDLRDQNALTNYLQKWFRFAVGLAGVFGVVRLVLVGFKIVAGAPSANAQSMVKKELVAIIGSLLLVAGSWIFLNTINPLLVTQNLIIPASTGTAQMKMVCEDPTNCEDLTPKDASGNPVPTDAKGNPILADNVTKGLGKNGYYYLVTDKSSQQKYWVGQFDVEQECINQATTQLHDPNAYVTIELAQGATTPRCMLYTTNVDPAFKQEEETDRALLREHNVAVNKAYCQNSMAKGCTNVSGLDNAVFANINGFADSCKVATGKDCGVVLTGGTEGNGMHKTHGKDFPYTYDMSSNSAIDAYLKKNATMIAPSFSHAIPNVRYYLNGWWYNYESSGATEKTTGVHYHVCMDNAPGVYESSKYWACKSVFLKNGEEVEFDDNYCPKNPNNPNQQLCLGVQAPN